MSRQLLLFGVSIAVAALAAALTSATVAEAANFNRIATWPVYRNLPSDLPPTTETVAEILAVTADGLTLVYTDSPGARLGLVDIADPSAPSGLGTVALGGEPTSVVIAGSFALAGVNTSESFTRPSGHVAVVDLAERTIVGRCDVGGQPDSLALSPDGAYVAVAVENERDEDLNDGFIPQLPPGHLAILDLAKSGRPTNCTAARRVDLTGLAEVAPSDPEPEFVAINGNNEAVVTLQENNHLVVVDLATGMVTAHFPAGSVTLTGVDATEDGRISLTETLVGVPREPDAVAWIDADRFVTADEGDYEGGGRGFTVYDKTGHVVYASGSSFDQLAASIGHYPEHRSENKGSEPEGAEAATFGDDRLIFIGSERGSFIAVYADHGTASVPEFRQVLPSAMGPEGIKAIPNRNLLAVATEVDDAEAGVRGTLSLYAYENAPAAYPTLQSVSDGHTMIAWGALSGLAANADDADILYAVNDSYYGVANIYTLDLSAATARITGVRPVTRDGEAARYDLEGIAKAADGGFWLVSEGRPGKRANLLIKTDGSAAVEREILLPAAIGTQAVRYGFEGVALDPSQPDGPVAVAFQRPWLGDPAGYTRIGLYQPADSSWGFIFYPLDPVESPAGGWVGLSEITALGANRYAVVERDNQQGDQAHIKRVYTIDLTGITPAVARTTPPIVKKTLALDLLPILAATHGWIPEKVEGLTVAADGMVYIVTDNDGVDDSSGETLFLQVGSAESLLSGK